MMMTYRGMEIYFLDTLTLKPPVQDLKTEDNIVVNIPTLRFDPIKVIVLHALMSLLY